MGVLDNMNEPAMFGGFQAGKDECSEHTFQCDGYGSCAGCIYNINDRCCYNVAKIQIRISRACYEELRQNEIEDELDYLEGMG